MANNIDKRIVEMQFDNAQFEKGVSTSLESLEKLKKGLELDSAVESLKNVETKLNKMDFRGISNSLSNIQAHFTTLGRNIDKTIDSIIENAKSKLLNFYKSTISGGSGSGFSKYETQTKSVQTITNATGKSVEEVEAVLGKLQKYTDETSYDFAEMASTIGKFTSVGVELGRAETAMEGIANVAAVSGADKNAANRAMYNFAQSLSQGSVKLIDWKSIENANMATKEFKEELIKTAISMGTITKVTDTAGKIVTQTKAATKKTAAQFKETAVDYKTFNETLKDGWLTSDVLITTLERYANKEDGVGKKAYEAAQKALTFTDAIDAIKDAISSSWMQSFKLMFGNLTESIDLWTNFCNAIIAVTDEIGSYRNELLQGWHEQGGYNDLIESASNIWTAFVNILHLVRDAFNSIIPATTADDLITITSKIKEVTESWKNFFDYIGTGSTEETVKELVNYAKEFEDNIKSGMSGDYVKLFQQALIDAGYTLDKYGADGIYGTETQKAIKRLQKDLGVSETGKWDEATRKAAILSGKFQGMEEVTKEISRGLGDTYTVLEKYTDTIDYASQIRTGLQYKAPTKGTDWDLLEDTETELLNQMLVYAGYMDNAQATSFFGPETEKAIKKLQAEYGLAQTGIWDEQTQAAAKANGIFSVTVTRTEEVTKTVGAQNTAMEKLFTTVQGISAAFSIFSNLAKVVFKVIAYVGSTVGNVLLDVSSALGSILVFVNNLLNSSGAYDSLFNGIIKLIKSDRKINALITILKKASEAINTFFSKYKNVKTFSELWEAFIFEISKNKAIKTIITYLNKFISWLTNAKNAIVSIAGVVRTWINNKITKWFKTGGDGVSLFQKTIKTMVDNVSNKFDELKKKYPVIGIISDSFTNAKNAIAEFYNSVKNKISGFFDASGNFDGNSFFEWIKTKVAEASSALTTFKDNASKAIGNVGTYFKTTYENALTWFTNLRKNYPVLDTILTKIENVYGIVSKFVGSVKDAFFSSFSGGSFNKVKFFETLKEKFEELKTDFSNFISSIKVSLLKFSWKHPGITKFVKFMQNAAKELKNFAIAVKDSLTNLFSGKVSSDGTLFDKIVEKLDSFQPVIDWFKDMIDKLKSIWNGGEGVLTSVSEGTSSNGVIGGIVENLRALADKVGKINLKKFILPALGILGAYIALSITKAVSNVGKAVASVGMGFQGLTTSLTNFIGTDSIGSIIGNAVNALSSSIKERPKDSIGTAFLKIAASIAIVAVAVTGVVVALSMIPDMDKAQQGVILFGEVLGALVVVAVVMAAVSKIAPNADKIGYGVLALTGSLIAIAASIWIMTEILNNNSSTTVATAIGIMAIMLLGLATIEGVLLQNSVGNKSTNISGILQMCIGLAVIALSVGYMASVVNKYFDKPAVIVGAVAIILAILAGLGIIEVQLAKNTKGKVKVSGILSMSLGLLLIVRSLSKVVKLIDEYGGMKVARSLLVVVALIGTIGGITALMNSTSKGLGSSIGNALQMVTMAFTIEKIANAFASAILKVKDVDTNKMLVFFGAVEVVSLTMSKIASLIGTNVGAALLGDLGLVALGAAIAGFIELIATAGADAVNKVATALWTLGAKMESFSNSMSNVDFAKVNTGMQVFKEIALRITEIAALSIGQGDVRGFVSCLQDLGTGLSNFSNNVENATLDKYSENGEFNTCVKALGKLLKSQDLTGHSENKTKNFTSALQSLGGGLGNFIDEVKDMDLSSYTGDDSTFKAGVLSLADLLSDTTITGVESGQTTAFTDELTDLSAGLVTFEGNVKQIGEGAMTNANDLISQAITTVGMVNVRLNASNIETMKTLLEKVSAAVQLYYNNLAKVDPSSAGATPEQIKAAFTGLSGAMPDDSEIASVAAYADGSDKAQSLLDFAEGLVNLGSAISSYGDNIGKLNPLKVMVANSVLKTISDLQTNLAGDDSNFLDMKDEVAAANTRNPLNQFGRNLINLGTSIGKYAENISGINPEEVKAANSVIETIAAVPSALNETASSGFWGFMTVLVGKEKTLQGFATDVRTLGTAIRKYALNIKGISSTDIETANTVIDKVSSIPTVLNKDDADAWEFFKSLFRHRQTITDFATDIGNLGGGLATYATDIGGLSYWKITLANSIIDKIANISLPSTGGFWQFLTGSQSLGNFASNLGSVGAGVKEFAEKVSAAPLDNINMVKALSPITILADAQSKLKDTDGLKSLLIGDANLGALGANLSEYGDKLVEFAGKVKDFNSEDISQAVEAMKSVIDQQVRIGSRYTNINAFSDLGNAINSFFLTLSTYATGGTGATMADDVTNLVYDLIIDICDAISGETSKMNIGSAVKTLFSTATVAIYGYKTQFSLAAKGLIDEMKTALGDPDGKINSAINSAVSGAATQVRNRYNDFYNAGNYLDQGLVVGIWKGSSAVSTTAWNVAVSAYNAACRALGIASPSKEFAKIGMFADMGLVNGLETYSDAVQSSASDVASGAIDGAQQGLTNFSSLIFDNMDDTPVIRPVLDLTDVQSGANAMNGMFRSQTVGLRSAELANRVSVSDYERAAAASVNTDSADIRGSIEMLNARIDELGQRIMNMQVVTETGAIIGAIAPGMDRALGNRSILAKRGAI